jgi:putative membrane protein
MPVSGILSAGSSLAHDGRPLAPHDLWLAWSFEPAVMVGLLLVAWLYGSGVRALWRSAGRGHGVRPWEAASFAAGWLTLVLALVSPIHRLGEVLFSAHMAQHELLMALAAPLIVLGRPLVGFLWAIPIGWRRSLGGWCATPPVRRAWIWISTPLVAWGLHALAIWLWHIPGLYQATLGSEAIHTAQHVSFLGSALLFWWALLRVREGRLGVPAAVLYLFTTAVHTSLLGALLAFSSRTWYPIYSTSTAAWGLTPLEDQQLAGLIMWVPAGLSYLVAALAVIATWLKEPAARRLAGRLGPASIPLLLALFLLGGCRRGSALTDQHAAAVTGGDPARGALAARQYGCAACHTIPGIPGARGTVGPPLAGIGGRTYIAGVLTNTPNNLIRWIQHPQQVDPLTAMPDVGATEPTVRDIAAYLYTQK